MSSWMEHFICITGSMSLPSHQLSLKLELQTEYAGRRGVWFVAPPLLAAPQDGVLFHYIICSLAHPEAPNE